MSKPSSRISSLRPKIQKCHQSTESDSDPADKESSNIKTFYYSISELSLRSNAILIDFDKYPNLSDLKREIALKLSISNDHLQFINPPKGNLKSIKNKSEFTLKVSCSHIDANLLIPNGKKILIQDCNTKDFDQIMQYLEKEGYYYSPRCIKNNLHLFFSNEEISNKQFPLLSVKNSGNLELKLFGNVVTINYDNNFFNFSDNDYSFDAKDLFQRVFPNGRISILELDGKTAFKLEPTKQYFIHIEVHLFFIDIKKGYRYYLQFDLLSTVLEVRKKLEKKT